MGIRIAPSMTSADIGQLNQQVESISNADWIHVDVMDNHFVPNLTYGMPVVEAVARASNVPVDSHLMITNPDHWAPQFVDAGARSVTFHAEAATAPIRLARELRTLGARAGLAVNPATSIDPYLELLPEFDMIVIMTVEPGFGGQKFLPSCLSKVRKTREAIARTGASVWLQVDGGVNTDTIEQCAQAGADVFVAGAAVFNTHNAADNIENLRGLAHDACAHLRA